jgi:hypothetical protein
LYRKVKRIVAGHHEFQTTAFPRGGDDRRDERRESGSERRTLDGQITRLTHIVAISDMFDALASKRSYKEPLAREEIEGILKDQYTGDPALINQALSRY